jgi:hypothetical protein
MGQRTSSAHGTPADAFARTARSLYPNGKVRPLAVEKKAPPEELVFFLSHRGPDAKDQLVRPLAHILKHFRVRVFFDQDPEDGIRHMKPNHREIARGLYACRVGVVFVSDGFLASKWCCIAADAAAARGRHRLRHCVPGVPRAAPAG